MKKTVNEDVVKFTDKQGGETVQSYNNLSDPEYIKTRDAVKSSGGKVTDMKTGKFLEEDKSNLTNNDLVNLGKQLQTVVEDTLKEHGDDVAFTAVKFNTRSGYIIIYVTYASDPNNPGGASEDRFAFDITDGKVRLVDAGTKTDICALDQQSGTININKDLAKNALMNFIKGETNVDIQEGCEKHYLEEFASAVEAYRTDRSKDNIKQMFRVARNFDGDTIQKKFKNAVQAWKNNRLPVQEEEIPEVPVEDVKQSSEKCTCTENGNICMNTSLFIRLLEFAKEEAKEDVDLHWLAQNAQNFSAERGCLGMGDYMQLISQSAFSPEKPVDNIPEPEQVVDDESATDDWNVDKKQDQYEKDQEAERRFNAGVEESEDQKWKSETDPWDSADRGWKQIALSKVMGNIRRDFSEEDCDRIYSGLSDIEKEIVHDYLRKARTFMLEEEKSKNYPYSCLVTFSEDYEIPADRMIYYIDRILPGGLKRNIMLRMSEMYDLPESLDDDIKDYADHTGVDSRQALDAANEEMDRGDKYWFIEHIKDVEEGNED